MAEAVGSGHLEALAAELERRLQAGQRFALAFTHGLTGEILRVLEGQRR